MKKPLIFVSDTARKVNLGSKIPPIPQSKTTGDNVIKGNLDAEPKVSLKRSSGQAVTVEGMTEHSPTETLNVISRESGSSLALEATDHSELLVTELSPAEPHLL